MQQGVDFEGMSYVIVNDQTCYCEGEVDKELEKHPRTDKFAPKGN